MIGATLCSGIGAPECAAPWIDWRWHAEIDPFPAAVHALRFPGSANLGDMTAPDLVERAAAIALPDVIVAGTPCQAFSLAGTRGSLADARGNLTLLFVRICDAIDDLRRAAGLAPLWVLWENVPGVFSVDDNAFGAFLAGMVGGDAPIVPPRGRSWTSAGVVSGPGRCAAWRILDAQHFGLAQRRNRVFVLARGGARDWSGPDALLPIIAGLRWHPAPRREARQRTARPIAASSPGGSGYRNDADTADDLIAAYGGNDTRGPIDVATACNAHGGPHGRLDFETETFIAHALRAEGFDASEDGTGRGTPLAPVGFQTRGSNLSVGEISGTFGTNAERASGSAPMVAHAFDARQSDVIQYGDRAGPLDTDGHSLAIAFSAKDYGADAGEVAPTLRSGGFDKSHANGGVMPAIASHTVVRRLTPRECERLQGFPDDWTLIEYRGKPAADGPRYKALGNSMAVPVMRHLLQRITDVENGR